MREFSRRFNYLWKYDSEKFYDELKKYLAEYNERWNRGYELFSYFKIFKSPIELGQYMVDTYENSEEADISMLENQLEVPKEEWLSICSTVHENDFMKRQFTEILNNRIKDML